MRVAVFVAFAGALAAAVGTGVLAGRFIRLPRSFLLAWLSVLLMLAVALGAQAVGFAIGFSGARFRAVEVSGLLFAPLWTAWGLVELAGRTLPARFAARLVTVTLTVVPGVILILDPLNSVPALGKAWPGETPYMVLPNAALTGIHLGVVVVALLMIWLTAVRARHDPAWWDVFVPVAAAGAAVLLAVSLRFTLPIVAYPLLTVAAVGLIWFAASRSERVRPNRLRSDHYPGSAEPRGGRRRRDRGAVDAGVGAAARSPASTGRTTGPATTGPATTGPATTGPATTGRTTTGPASGPPPTGRSVAFGPDGIRAGSQPMPASVERTGPTASGTPLTPPRKLSPPLPPVAGAQFGQPATAVVSPHFGLIAIYTLREGHGEAFDRLAERTAEAVLAQEPATLLFVVHAVPKFPMQRIFYEVYRDRMAYSEHRRMQYVEDFFAGHRQHVLATNVIELDLRYAKVSALPSLAAMSGPTAEGD